MQHSMTERRLHDSVWHSNAVTPICREAQLKEGIVDPGHDVAHLSTNGRSYLEADDLTRALAEAAANHSQTTPSILPWGSWSSAVQLRLPCCPKGLSQFPSSSQRVLGSFPTHTWNHKRADGQTTHQRKRPSNWSVVEFLLFSNKT